MPTWVLDLDGVVWLDDAPVRGSANAIARLRGKGVNVVFMTNNSSPTAGEYLVKLRNMGIGASPDELITSAQAAASMLKPGEAALVVAGRGVDEALQRRGIRVVRTGRADAVIVGWQQDFDYQRLTAAMRAVRAGARLIGTNSDPTYPTQSGPVPGGGALLAAVSYASEAQPEVAGKPNKAIVALLQERVGRVDVVVGDRPSTDGLLARRLGARFGLVLTGVTTEAGLPVDPAPDHVAADLATLVEQLT